MTYAVYGNESAGFNGAYGGIAWLDRPSSHYTWTTDIYEYICGVYYCLDYVTQSNGSSQVVPWAPPTTFLIQLVSDGDFPLNITGTIAQVQVQGYGTVGTGKVTSVTGTQVMNPDGTVEAPIGCLPGPVAPGTTCGLAVTFDPSGVTAAASTGYGYNAMYLELVSDAGALPGWNGHFTITGIPAPSTPD